MKDIGLGIIGLDGGQHLLALNELLDAHTRVVAICDESGLLARRLGQRHKIPFVTTDPIDLLSQPGVDAVALFGRSADRYGYCLAAMGAGKHVLSATPLCASDGHVAELARESAANGLKLLVTNPLLATREVEAARVVLDRGDLGSVKVIDVLARVFLSPDSRSPGSVPADSILGALEIIESFGGEISELYSVGGPALAVTARLGGGIIARAMLIPSTDSSDESISLSIHGECGRWLNGRVCVRSADGQPPLQYTVDLTSASESALLRSAREFESLIMDPDSDADGLVAASRAAVLLAAIEESLSSNLPICVNPSAEETASAPAT